MIQIIKDGAPIALTERVNYIRRHADGFYILCSEADAQGVAYEGTPYNLFGREPMEGLDEVMLAETDGGAVLRKTEQTGVDLDALAVDHEFRLTLIELGVTE